MGKIVKLKNANDVYTYPVTKTEAVYLEDNKTTLKDYLDAMAITKTAGPAQIIAFDDGADNIPVKSLILNIEPHQEGTGDPSPSNIRHITGCNEINVTRSGKNLFDKNSVIENSYIASDGSINTSTAWVISNYMPITNELYYSGHKSSFGTNPCAAYYDANYNFISSFRQEIGSGEIPTLSGAKYVRMSIAKVNIDTVQVELGNTATDYEPYAGQTYEITIPSAAGTIYSGTLDVINGVLTVDKKMLEFDGSNDEFWQYGSNRFNTAAISDAVNHSSREQVLCNIGKFASSGSTEGTVFLYNALIFYYAPSTITSVADFRTWLASNKMQVVYPLATPLVYNLTSAEVATLLGNNVIWISTNDTLQVIYKADLATYIVNAISSSNS